MTLTPDQISSMTVQEHEFRDFVDNLFQEKREGAEGFMHAGGGLAFEAGETGDHCKKHWVYGREIDRDKLIEEMGDTFHYFTMLMIKMNIVLADVINHNVAKLRKRYPNGFTKFDAIARADKFETAIDQNSLITRSPTATTW